MNRIKIFNNSADRISILVNDWIEKENPNIIQISTTGEGEYRYVLTVLYNDNKTITLNS
jgi:hypothetical protein